MRGDGPPRPTDDVNPLATPREYPARPADLTAASARSYLRAYEKAFVENDLMANANSPEGTYPFGASVDPTVTAFRAGDSWFLAGISCFGTLGYDTPGRTATGTGTETATGTGPTTTTTGTPTQTHTALPSITVSRIASYLLTDRFLLRQDRGPDAGDDPPAAVEDGVVYACF